MSDEMNQRPAGVRARPQRDEAEIAEAIVEYLAEHPRAMDTLSGIAEWWLPLHRVRFEVEAVGRVVRRLAAEGVLEEITDDGQPRYHLKKREETPEPAAPARGRKD